MSRLLQLLRGASKSNTVQFNSAVGLLWVLSKLSELDWVMGDPDRAALIAGIVAIVNLVLRFKTTKPLTER